MKMTASSHRNVLFVVIKLLFVSCTIVDPIYGFSTLFYHHPHQRQHHQSLVTSSKKSLKRNEYYQSSISIRSSRLNEIENEEKLSREDENEEYFSISQDEYSDYEEYSHNNSSSSREISVSASIILPFSSKIAFDAFSDLPRQPSWSSWLKSVSYLDENDETQSQCIVKEEDGSTNVRLMPQSKWVMGWKKFSFSWKSKVTYLERPYLIEFESTSGLKNMGRITFDENNKGLSESSTMNYENDPSLSLLADTNEITTTATFNEKTFMTLTLTFVAPRIVASLMRRSDKIAFFMKKKILHPTLEKFRDIVMVDLNQKI